MIVDTGATANIVSGKFAARLKKATQPTKSTLRSVSGELLSSCGEMVLEIVIGPVHVRTEFVVLEEFPYDILCGLPFCAAAQMVIDFPGKNIVLQGHALRLNLESPLVAAPPSAHRAYCMETTTIPACSEVLLPVTITGQGAFLIEPLPETSLTRPSVARTLTEVSANVGYARVANPSSSPITITRGTAVGRTTSLFAVQLATTPPQNADGSISEVDVAANLGCAERNRVHSLLNEYAHLFSEKGCLGRTHLVEHEIDTENARPVRQNPYRNSTYERQVVREQVSDMLQRDVIRESTSPWSSPVVLVRKRDGSWRFCVDYRKVNAVTKRDVHPIPRVDDILDMLQGSRFFTTLDLASGYWQIPVREKDKEKTAFTTGAGLYEFNVLPFGMCNAPATFQRMINKVLASQLWKVCLAYLDDIIVFSRTVDDHLQDLRGIFEALSKAGLRLQPKKCKVAASSVLYLGHVIDGKSVRPDPDNIRAVSNFPRPRNVKEVRSFLGICNYYRRFVKDFARISRPLNDLTRCDVKWSWNRECENAFDELKQHLTGEPVLRLFDPSLPIEVHTDACGYGIGAVLVQRDGTQEYAVGYASRHLNAAEANYSTTEQECLAVVYATRQFRPYLFGVPFTVVTDQSSLTWLMTVKNPNGRLIRWSLLLQEFNIALKHRPGKKNGNADALSRLPYDPAPQEEEELPLLLVEGGNIVQNQRADPFLGPIVGHLERPQDPVVRKVKRAARAFSLVNGILFRRAKGYEAERMALAVPRTLRQEILVSCHDDVTAGHLGIKRTIDKIRQRYFWPRMFADITRYVMSCPDCQTRKTPPLRPAGLLQPLPPAQRPFQRVGMDFLGPLTSSQDGNKYVVVIIDYHTKWVETVATPDATAASAAKAFMQAVVLRHGAPETVLTDRGRHFVSEMMEELFRLLDTNHARTTAYHPQTNGLCERFNRTLADMISKYVSSGHQD